MTAATHSCIDNNTPASQLAKFQQDSIHTYTHTLTVSGF